MAAITLGVTMGRGMSMSMSIIIVITTIIIAAEATDGLLLP
jgi:hypothetical protein